VQLRNFLKIIL